ncbi:MAG: heavy metal-binding domain-containing protein [Chitinophagales bacterium]|nr:heavy metal-binding domain-containing protein [Chitinophagales bacterium]
MTNFIKSILVAATFGVAIGITSCGGNTENQTAETGQHVHDDSHEHTYACPMHPEVVGHEGEKCPKCGMALTPIDAAASQNTNTYIMEVKTGAEKVEAGKAVTLSLTPRIQGKETEQVALDVQHGKKIHLIIVNDALTYFDHIHPDYNAEGNYTVETRFPAGGKYLVFTDYKPAGATAQLGKAEIKAEGKEAAAIKFAEKTTATTEGYTVKLTPVNGSFVTGEQMHIYATVNKGGKEIPADKLEDYLEAKAHVVMISAEGKDYLHVHPEVENGKLDLHTTFDKPGIYRVWVQFQTEGKVRTADFTLDVKQGSGTATGAQDHDDHGHSHDHHSGHKH